MIFQQKLKRPITSLSALAFFTLCACNNSSTQALESNGKICDIELKREETSNTFTESTSVSYTGNLSADCQQKTSALSGRAQVNLAAQSKVSSASISLQELKAGKRNLQFDASADNFMRGTYEKRFDSSFYPDWSLPWSDKPTQVTLSMTLTDNTLMTALPASVRVELLY